MFMFENILRSFSICNGSVMDCAVKGKFETGLNDIIFSNQGY